MDRRNAVRCIGVEEKMGIHASPTCTLAYEGATGWLIGEENRGLAAMFTMMNAARLNVGLEGVAVAEAAYQKALAYAQERKQGGALIIQHPDVRRMLTHMRAKIQAGRAICYATAVAADGGDKAREDLLTPIAKAWCTDLGVEAASLGVQVHGGMGFVEEGGAAQFYRDARIAPIYEGTNGIQAIDLYGRKLLSDRGEAMGALINDARKPAMRSSRPAAPASSSPPTRSRKRRNTCSAPLAKMRSRAPPNIWLAGDVAGGLYSRAASPAPGQAAMTRPSSKTKPLFAYYSETCLLARRRACRRFNRAAARGGGMRLAERRLKTCAITWRSKSRRLGRGDRDLRASALRNVRQRRGVRRRAGGPPLLRLSRTPFPDQGNEIIAIRTRDTVLVEFWLTGTHRARSPRRSRDRADGKAFASAWPRASSSRPAATRSSASARTSTPTPSRARWLGVAARAWIWRCRQPV